MDASNLEGIEEIFEQTSIRVNKRTRRRNFGWAIPPSIERAAAAREGKAIAKPAALVPADDERGTSSVGTPSGTQEMLTISEPVTSYTELICGIRARVGQLEVRYLDFDKLAGFAEGLSGKVFGAAQIKRLGIEKMFDAIRAAGLRLRLEEDPEQTAKMQIRISENFNPRQAKQARMNNRSHLSNALIDEVLSHLANKRGGLARLRGAVKQARSNWARHASKAFWEKKRQCGTRDNVLRIRSAPALPSPELSRQTQTRPDRLSDPTQTASTTASGGDINPTALSPFTAIGLAHTATSGSWTPSVSDAASLNQMSLTTCMSRDRSRSMT
jgi:hypothetical protein